MSAILKALLIFVLIVCIPKQAWTDSTVELLNASFDATRALFDEIDEAFSRKWNNSSAQQLIIRQSHGGSGKQARSVLYGLQADVVSLALAYDVNMLASKGFIDPSWESRLPNRATPFSSTIVFVVRSGNPKKIQQWSDLWREDVIPVSANPKTSGGARWNYLAAWGAALLENENNPDRAKQLVAGLFKRIPVLDAGARAATMNFAHREIGDVLLTWESEAYQALEVFGSSKLEIIVPDVSIKAEPKFSLVDKVVDKRGTREVAESYLQFLYSPLAQELVAKHHFRGTSLNAVTYEKPERLFTVEEFFGGWAQAQKTHFEKNGSFDQIFEGQ